MKKAYQMTLSEYQQTVTPLLNDFFKFLKKSKKFIKQGYFGLEYLSFDEYIGLAKENHLKSEYFSKYPFDPTLATSNWRKILESEPIQASESEIDTKEELFKKVIVYFTDKGVKNFEKDEIKSNKREVRRAVDADLYVKDLIEGNLTPSQVEEIFLSVGLKVPKNVQEMKEKVSKQGYNRSIHDRLMISSKDFEEKIRKALKPHMDKLADRYRSSVNSVVEDFFKWCQNTGMDSVSKYAQSVTQSRSDYNNKTQLLYKYTVKGQKSDKYDQMLDVAAERYAESFVLEFVLKVNDKLKVLNQKKGIPTFEIKNLQFSQQRIEGFFDIHYSDGTSLYLETDVILAGGYNIQGLHNRYLFKLFKDGKMVKLEDIDKAFENLNEKIKLNRYNDFKSI